MTYVKVDDHFPEHPKVLDIGPLAEALWLRGLCYASRNRTDGAIPRGFVVRMHDMDGLDAATMLSSAGLWEQTDTGWRIHDYPDWQRSKAEIEDISAKRSLAGSKGGKQKASNLLERSSDLLQQRSSKTYPDTDTDTDTDTEKTATTIVVGDDDEPNDPPKKPKAPPKPVARSIPDGWAVSDDLLRFGESLGLTEGQIRSEADAFVDHFTGTGGRKVDWSATFRNWLRNTSKFQSRAPTPLRASNGKDIGYSTKELIEMVRRGNVG
jgi:hypothetical protein